jgi:hypothetical protein
MSYRHCLLRRITPTSPPLTAPKVRHLVVAPEEGIAVSHLVLPWLGAFDITDLDRIDTGSTCLDGTSHWEVLAGESVTAPRDEVLINYNPYTRARERLEVSDDLRRTPS